MPRDIRTLRLTYAICTVALLVVLWRVGALNSAPGPALVVILLIGFSLHAWLGFALFSEPKARRLQSAFLATAELVYWFVILSPVVTTGGRPSIQRTACLSQGLQLARALLMYAKDHDDTLPPAVGWRRSIQPLVKSDSLFVCPFNSQSHFILNSKIAGRKLTDEKANTNTVAVFESLTPNIEFGTLVDFANNPHHFEKTTTGFLDGHVKWMSAEDATKLKWSIQTASAKR